MTALKAMTIWPAWQHFEEDQKGSIEVGTLADFVILSEDPTAVDPEGLDQLRVKVTIKEDSVVYEAEVVRSRSDGAATFPGAPEALIEIAAWRR
jgi:predicted amidohydrolase YtcJ